jgi:hypothetical protein
MIVTERTFCTGIYLTASESTRLNSKAKNQDACGIRAIHPRPEGQGFSRKTDKKRRSMS